VGDAGDVPEVRPPTVDDIRRICRALDEAGARYVLIGGFAVILHGGLRTTKDIDLLVDPDPANVDRLKRALSVLEDDYGKSGAAGRTLTRPRAAVPRRDRRRRAEVEAGAGRREGVPAACIGGASGAAARARMATAGPMASVNPPGEPPQCRADASGLRTPRRRGR
jgi:hypothetical protein